MGRLLNSKPAAWGGLILIVIWLIFTLKTDEPWWGYLGIFFAFMMVFCHIASLYLERMSQAASRKLDLIAFICGVLFIVAIIVIYIVEAIAF